MPVLTLYSNMPDDEFLRKLEVDVAPDKTEVRVEPELWLEILARMEKLDRNQLEDNLDDD